MYIITYDYTSISVFVGYIPLFQVSFFFELFHRFMWLILNFKIQLIKTYFTIAKIIESNRGKKYYYITTLNFSLNWWINLKHKLVDGVITSIVWQNCIPTIKINFHPINRFYINTNHHYRLPSKDILLTQILKEKQSIIRELGRKN